MLRPPQQLAGRRANAPLTRGGLAGPPRVRSARIPSPAAMQEGAPSQLLPRLVLLDRFCRRISACQSTCATRVGMSGPLTAWCTGPKPAPLTTTTAACVLPPNAGTTSVACTLLCLLLMVRRMPLSPSPWRPLSAPRPLMVRRWPLRVRLHAQQEACVMHRAGRQHCSCLGSDISC
jgi:hypothetical protein